MANRRPRVLLADDNAELRSLLVSRLAGHGYDAVGAGDGVDALAQIARRPPDILITDIVMPRLDGIGLVERVRGNPATAQIPVIVMSGWFGDIADDQQLPMGADAFLRKPPRTSELMAHLARLLEGRSGKAKDDRGILVSTTLQVLQVLEHTGLVEVRSSQGEGSLRLHGGEVTGAVTGKASGEAAAREILAWTKTEVKLRDVSDRIVNGQIRVPLADLLAPPGGRDRPLAPVAAVVEPAVVTPADSVIAELWPQMPGMTLELAPFQWQEEPGPEEEDLVAAVAPDLPSQPEPAHWAGAAAAFVNAAIDIRGALAAVMIDVPSGTTLREAGAFDGDNAPLAGAISRLVDAERAVLASLGQTEAIEYLVITLTDRVFVLRPLAAELVTLLLLVLDKGKANLALALRGIERIEYQLRP